MIRQTLMTVVAVALCALLCGSAPADNPSAGDRGPSGAEDDVAARIQAKMAEINVQLGALGEKVRVAAVEFYTEQPQVGQIVYYNDRDLWMGSHWVPFDPWRYGVREIYWLSDQTEGAATGVSLADTQAALSRAMATWDGEACASIPLVQLPDSGIDWGVVQWLEGFGGVPYWYADLTHAGWLDRNFFDAVAPPDGGDFILGMTFTFVWLDAPPPDGEPTDIDNNGKEDVAFREIYYNNAFTWGIDTALPIDVETVVLHEVGHGLSLDHFGRIFVTTANGELHFAPRALMNAAYTGLHQALSGTDSGAFCSIWSSWPHN